MRRVNWIEEMGKDLTYAFRLLKKSPGFTLTAVVSLALGIGANTAIFSVVNAFLLRPLPFRQPERLAALYERNVIGNEQRMSVAPGNFLDWQQTAKSFEQMAAYTMGSVTLSSERGVADAQRVMICYCSGNIFSTLGVEPAEGRPFRRDEDRHGAPQVAVISFDLWQRQYGGSRQIIGKMIRLDGEDYQLIGVMPRGFAYPYRGVEVWSPLLAALLPDRHVRHDLHFLNVVGRLRPGVSVEQAGAEIDGISGRYKNMHPDVSTGRGAAVVPLHPDLVQNVRTPLIILLGAVSCVLLIACVNIANLLLTRALARTREIGIRAALGASRGRLIRQLVSESILLGLAGGAVGAALALSVTRVLANHAPGADAVLPNGSVAVDLTVFLFALAVALATGIAIGLVPAIRASHMDLATGLKDSTRSSTTTRAHGRFRNALVMAEVALSLVLLVAAGLLLHSFSRLYQVQPGVRLDHTLMMSTSLPSGSYSGPAERAALFSRLGERLGTLPGVKAAGLTSCPPLSGACNILFFYIEGRPVVPGKFFAALERSIDPGYFEAAGIPLLRGRTFTRNDGTGFDVKNPRPGSVIISEAMARTFFPYEDPIGKRIFFDFEVERARHQGTPVPRYEVVGIAGDVLPTLDGKIQPTLYRPLLDGGNSGAAMVLHTAVDPHLIVTAAENEIRKLDRGLAVYEVQTMEDRLGNSAADRRFNLLLFAAFAALAVVLAAVGLYGVVSYAVSQRGAEMGIRMALGATGSDVSRLVLMQGLKPALAGIALGLVVAAFASRILRSLLFGVSPADPAAFVAVPILLMAVATLACYLPARRVMRLDPTVALRTE